MSRFIRFRRGKRVKALRELVRPPFAERMKRFKPQPRKPTWWAMIAGAVVVAGLIGWTFV